jgi:hypothetical protein
VAVVTDPDGWQVEPCGVPDELEEWWAWHSRPGHEPQPTIPEDPWARRVVTIDPGPYL